MSVPKPTGEFADQMIAGGGWPEINEDLLYDRGERLRATLLDVTSVLQTWRDQQTKVFGEPGSWSGGAAAAANDAVGKNIAGMEPLQNQLVNAITWYNYAADVVATVKGKIAEYVEDAHEAVQTLRDTPFEDPEERDERIKELIQTVNGVNRSVVSTAWITQFSDWHAPDGALEQLLKSPPAADKPPAPHEDGEASNYAPSGWQVPNAPTGGARNPVQSSAQVPQPHIIPSTPTGVAADGPAAAAPPSEAPAVPAAAAPPSPVGGSGGTSSPSTGGTSSSGGGSTASPTSGTSTPSSSSGSATTANPAAATSKPTDAAAAGGPAAAAKATPAQPVMPQVPLGPPAAATPPAPAPTPTPTGPPTATAGAAPPAGVSTSSGVGGGGIPGGGGAAPVGAAPGPSAPSPPVPLGPPATPPPAAPTPGAAPAGPVGPGVVPASTANTSAGAPPAPVPVSAARAERDAIATASTAGALRRQAAGNNPLQLARRIGAALNVGTVDFGFFWVTGITTDNRIAVANSYGLAYIPDDVHLPEKVHMVTADESIPISDRATWATYPILALQGWAQHHNVALRAVVATEDQFADFDPGVAKIILQPDDIPDSGKMEGRSRLEVIAPEAATRLASVGDLGLTELLPPAPADINPPADESHTLWFEVAKPLMSTSTQRAVAHLEAFLTYANHAQELALHRAHTATDAVSQRAAIANWVYWQHLSVLMSDAVSSSASV